MKLDMNRWCRVYSQFRRVGITSTTLDSNSVLELMTSTECVPLRRHHRELESGKLDLQAGHVEYGLSASAGRCQAKYTG